MLRVIYCYVDRIGGLLLPYIVTTFITMTINSTITRGKVNGILRPESTSNITRRHSKTSTIRNTIVNMMVGGEMVGISRHISNTFVTNHVEIARLSVVVTCTIFGVSLLSVIIRMAANAFNGLSTGWVFPAILELGKEGYFQYLP